MRFVRTALLLCCGLAAAPTYADDDLFGPTNGLSNFGGPVTSRPPSTSLIASPRQMAAVHSICSTMAADTDIADAFGCAGSPWTSAPYAGTVIAEGCAQLKRISAALDDRIRAADRSLASPAQIGSGAPLQIERTLDAAHLYELQRASNEAGCTGTRRPAPAAASAKRPDAGAAGLCGGYVTGWEISRLPDKTRQYALLVVSTTDGTLYSEVSNYYPWVAKPSEAPEWIAGHCDVFHPHTASSGGIIPSANEISNRFGKWLLGVLGEDVDTPCEPGPWTDMTDPSQQKRCTQWLQSRPNKAVVIGVHG